MNRTGMASGRVRPIVYFMNPSGRIILPPEAVGEGLALARKIYEERYKYQGWQWCETDGSFRDAAKLQSRLQDQALNEARQKRDVSMAAYDYAKRQSADAMRAQMQSASCTPWERDFIAAWLDLSEEKRAKYEAIWDQHQGYLWAIENDANTKVEDRMPSQPGEFWRNEAQQKL